MLNTGNRLVKFNGWMLQYDADGNLTRKAKSGKPTQTFQWNSLGQLTKATVGSTTATYKYDGLGRWIRRKRGSTTLDYVYDDQNLFMIVDGGTTLRREFAYYPGLDRLHSQRNWRDENGVPYYYAQDDPGHVIGLVNKSRQAANRYSYDPWGEAQQNVEDVHNPLRFMGRFRDFHTGLYQVRARWYDPQVGRFISEDPIGLAGGINTYAYANNDPMNNRDPSGLLPEIHCWYSYESYASVEGAGVTATLHCTRSGGGSSDRGSDWSRAAPEDRSTTWAASSWPGGTGAGRTWDDDPEIRIAIVPGMEWISGPGKSLLIGSARRFIGKPFRPKIGAGGRPQPYGADGRYLPFEANPGVAYSPSSQIGSGFMSGYLEVVAGTPAKAFPGRLYGTSQAVGRFVGSIRQLF